LNKDNFEEMDIIKLVVTSIFRRFAKTFVLLVSNGLNPWYTQALSFFPKFYVQYIKLVEIKTLASLQHCW